MNQIRDLHSHVWPHLFEGSAQHNTEYDTAGEEIKQSSVLLLPFLSLLLYRVPKYRAAS